MSPTPGIDAPDRRGRTGLDRHGRDLTGNPRVRVRDVDVLSCDWYVLRRTTFDFQHSDGSWSTQQRETYDRGDGATVLLYDPVGRTVLLTRQFRFPAYVNGHPDGMLVEAAAGLLDGDAPGEAVRREAAEETGHAIGEVRPVFEVYMSPGSVTERLHFFAAPYEPGAGRGGGGVAAEGEDISVLELPFAEALAMVRDGRIADAKTIMLLQWAALDGPFAPSAGEPSPGREPVPAREPAAVRGPERAREPAPARDPAAREPGPARESVGRVGGVGGAHDAYVAKVNAAVAAGRADLVAELAACYARETG
ncbi:NUDIX domain-containing protein [Longispora sp. K20-0274]|uniref:NUDIX domain-containing protein n=1 Tax=Longispora sp. K20-0274 TaxID=3088255 RepID=UPI00399B3904